jgi:phosphocarrier protein HPr
MVQRTVVVGSSVGLHARPASVFVQAVVTTGAKVTLTTADGTAVNAASILSVLALGIPHGASVTLASENEEAVDSLAALLEKDLE